jgi:hypothetical protein
LEPGFIPNLREREGGKRKGGEEKERESAREREMSIPSPPLSPGTT